MSSCSEDQEESGEERDEEEEEQSDADSQSKSSQDDENAFKLKPLDPHKDFNADGTKKFKAKTRLML